jgi:hypothetical protein
MFASEPLLSAAELAKLFTVRLAEHLPGTDTGDPEITDKRTSWNKACQAAVDSLARSLEFRMTSSSVSEFAPERQLDAILYKNDAPVLVVGSAWTDRAELDRSFHRLLLMKAPQKMLIYSCKKSQKDVLDQLSHAVACFPYHLAGEEYVAINIASAEQQSFATALRLTHDGHIPPSAAHFHDVKGSPFPLRLARFHR